MCNQIFETIFLVGKTIKRDFSKFSILKHKLDFNDLYNHFIKIHNIFNVNLLLLGWGDCWTIDLHSKTTTRKLFFMKKQISFNYL